MENIEKYKLCLYYTKDIYKVLAEAESLEKINSITRKYEDERHLKTSDAYSNKILKARVALYDKIKELPSYNDRICIIKGNEINRPIEPNYKFIDIDDNLDKEEEMDFPSKHL